MSDPAPEPDLTTEELHDVTCAALAQNEFEAIALVDLLNEAGIPAAKRGGIIQYPAIDPVEIIVPRVLIMRAKSAIAAFRGEAVERGVQEAFDPENIEEQRDDADRDPTAADMLDLANSPSTERDEELPEYVAEWLAEDMPLPEMARYLAAAGLQRHEAEALIAKVKSERKDLIASALNQEFYGGLGLCALGLGLLFVPIPFQLPAAVSVFIAGLCLALHARSK